MSRWGGTKEEATRPMPLDERVPNPALASTRAISIDAPPEEIWPWIVQMGDAPRAGYYSYAFIERLQGMRIAGAERILPEYQELRPGDHLDRAGTMVVQHIDAPRALVLGPPPSVEWLQCTWAFVLNQDSPSSTRLVTRVRARFSYRAMLRAVPPPLWPMWLLIEPGIFIMERKMLLEIKRLSEAQGGERITPPRSPAKQLRTDV
jgi:hypothetical protein